MDDCHKEFDKQIEYSDFLPEIVQIPQEDGVSINIVTKAPDVASCIAACHTCCLFVCPPGVYKVYYP